MSRYLLLIAALVFVPAMAGAEVARAQAPKAPIVPKRKLVVRWERPTPDGIEQVGLIFDDSGARLVRNTNFLDDQRREAVLGRFHVNRLSPRLATAFRAAVQVLERTPKFHATSAAASKGPRFFLNLTPIPSDSPYSVALAEILRDVDRKASWVADDGVRVRKDQKRGIHLGRSKVAPAALSCRKAGKNATDRCDLAAYGTAYFGDQH